MLLLWVRYKRVSNDVVSVVWCGVWCGVSNQAEQSMCNRGESLRICVYDVCERVYYACMRECVHVSACACACARVHVCTCARVYKLKCSHMASYKRQEIRLYVCMYLCVLK